MKNRWRRLLAGCMAAILVLLCAPMPTMAADCTHNYVISGIAAGTHSQTCTLCGNTKTEDHSMTITKPSEVNADNADAHGVACSVCGLAYEQGHTYAYKDTVLFWKNYNCTACGYVDNSDTIGTCPGTHRYRLISYTDDQHTLGCTYADCTTQTSAAHSWDAGTDVTPEGSFYTVVKYTCDAGCVKYDYTKIETHVCTWQYSGSTATTHTQTCAECGETKTENHTFTTSWTSGNAVYHDLTCACGFSKQQVHSWTKGTLQYHCDYCDAAGLEGQLHDCDTNGHSCFVDSYTDDQHTLACHDPTCTYTVTEGHTWDAGKVLQEATMTQYGITRYTCTGGCVKDVYSAKLDHAHNWTIEDLGNNQYKKTCSVCNTVVTWYGYPIEEHYQAAGTYDVSMKSYTYTDNGNGVTECRFYYPYELTTSDATWPVVVICNGSGSGFGAGDAENYVALFNLLASWGFIVVANNDENSGTGDSAEFTLDKLLAANADSSSVFYGKVNTDAVGVWGHSQGGAGAINAASVTTNASYYKSVFLASISEAGRSEGVGFPYAGNIPAIANLPCMMISGANGFFELTVAGGPEALITNYPKFNNAVAGIREDLEHGHTILGAKGYVVAWFRYTLMGDTYAAQAFHGSNAEFLKNEYWNGKYDAENEGVVYQWLNGAQIKNTPHVMGEYEDNGDASCTSVGTQTANCQVAGCAHSDTMDNEGTAAGHTEEVVPGKDATCTESGLTEGKKCTACGETTVEQQEIPAGHTIAQGEAQAKTCTQDGWEAYEYCTECDYTTKVVIPAGHTIAQGEAQAKTCTQDGWEAYEYCTECDYTTKVIDEATGHTYGNATWTWTGNDADGYTEATAAFKCSCGDTQTVTDRDIAVQTTDATYEAAGSIIYTASVAFGEGTYTDTKTVEIPKLEIALDPIVDMTGEITPATITAPEGGWKLGDNTFSVMCKLACMIVYTEDDGENYYRLSATPVKDEDDNVLYYTFDVTLTENTKIVIYIKGDIDGDGEIEGREVTQIKAVQLSDQTTQTRFSALQIMIADVDGDGKIEGREATQIKAAQLYDRVLAW